jgi:ATP-dependent Zn protease
LKRIVSAELDRLWKRACSIMLDNRDIIATIADTLITRRTLAGEEIAEIVFAHDDADTGIDAI